MIDLVLLREQTATIKELILRKDPTFPVDELISLDQQVRHIKNAIELLRKEKNNLSSQAAHGVTEDIKKHVTTLNKSIKEKEIECARIEEAFKKCALSCPNIPESMLPIGNKEANTVVKIIGKKPEFTFAIKNHLELNKIVQWFDLDICAKISGSGFVLYKSMGAKIIYALTKLMLKNNARYGFEPIIPPVIINEEGLYNSGNLPKFAGDFYTIDGEKACLIPTAEVSLTNIYANTILKQEDLPIRMSAWTSCFRKEAGTYGSQERGLIRIHQFEKVEIYSLCEPEKSQIEHEHMLTCAEKLLQDLGIHYRISLLATEDCSFSSAKTFDIEVWLPGQNRYYEISSSSNCTDFQARRAQIRYKTQQTDKPTLVHTLNTSSLALPRLMVAIMENFQQEDGSIILPVLLAEEIKNLW